MTIIIMTDVITGLHETQKLRLEFQPEATNPQTPKAEPKTAGIRIIIIRHAHATTFARLVSDPRAVQTGQSKLVTAWVVRQLVKLVTSCNLAKKNQKKLSLTE